MDYGSSRDKKVDFDKNQDIMGSVKNSVEYIAQIFKICHSPLKPINDPTFNLMAYCIYIEKTLKKLIGLIPKQMVKMDTHQKLVKELEELNDKHRIVLKDYREYKSEVSALETQLAEAEERERAWFQIKQQDTILKRQFSRQIETNRKQSENKLSFMASPGKPESEHIVKGRKNSLPLIVSIPKIKSPGKSGIPKSKDKTQRLVCDLNRKY